MNPGVPAPARDFTRALVRNGGGSVKAVLLYGSQLHRSSPNKYSAWDLVVVVDRYAPFHRAMHERGLQNRHPVLMNLLSGVLPPYVTAFNPPELETGLAKCVVLSERHFFRALGPRAPDHFLLGRFAQHVEVVWTASERYAQRVEAALEQAQDLVLSWAAPFLESPFDAATLTQRMLEVSFAAELRPEKTDRVTELWTSQKDWFLENFERVLEKATERGILCREPDGLYRFRNPPGRWTRARVRFYLARSNVRGTLHLTPAEKRWPLILLWPKVIRVLRHARGKGSEDGIVR
jgi:hypothetical protein